MQNRLGKSTAQFKLYLAEIKGFGGTADQAEGAAESFGAVTEAQKKRKLGLLGSMGDHGLLRKGGRRKSGGKMEIPSLHMPQCSTCGSQHPEGQCPLKPTTTIGAEKKSARGSRKRLSLMDRGRDDRVDAIDREEAQDFLTSLGKVNSGEVDERPHTSRSPRMGEAAAVISPRGFFRIAQERELQEDERIEKILGLDVAEEGQPPVWTCMSSDSMQRLILQSEEDSLAMKSNQSEGGEFTHRRSLPGDTGFKKWDLFEDEQFVWGPLILLKEGAQLDGGTRFDKDSLLTTLSPSASSDALSRRTSDPAPSRPRTGSSPRPFTHAASMVPPTIEEKGWRVEPGGRRAIMRASVLKPVEVACDWQGLAHSLPRFDVLFHGNAYLTHFYNSPHWNYLAETEKGPIVVSIECTEEDESFEKKKKKLDSEEDPAPSNPSTPRVNARKVLVRSETCDTRHMIMGTRIKNVLKGLGGVNPILNGAKLTRFPDTPEVQSALVEFEKSTQPQPRMKIGVLCVKPGQTVDDQFFANRSGSKYYDEFLNFIGEKITLKGWNKFRGGLDVENDTTGTHTYYTVFDTCEILYHVSTMLPFDEEDKQHLERKRHLGNDVCVLVFLDTAAGTEFGDKEVNSTEIPLELQQSIPLFDPESIHSHFIHVYMAVAVDFQETARKGVTCYRLQVRFTRNLDKVVVI